MSSSLADRGYMLVQEPIHPVTGQVWNGPHKLEFDIVGCKHCGAVIKIVLRGVNAALTTRFRCQKCHGPICRYCATVLGGAKGNCLPQAAQVNYALKTGRRPQRDGILDYRDSPLC